MGGRLRGGVCLHGPSPGSGARGKILFDQVAKAHGDDLYRFLYSMVRHREDAQDLLQETFESAYRHRNRWPDVHGWRPWLFVIARNKAISLLRRKALLRWVPLLRSRLPEVVTSDPAREAIERLTLESMFAVLSPPERETYVLRLQGFTYEEIAAICQVTPAAVRTRIHRARTKLRLLVTGGETEEGR